MNSTPHKNPDSLGLPERLHLELKWLLKRLLGLKLVWVSRRRLGSNTAVPEQVQTQIASDALLASYYDDPSYELNERSVAKHLAVGDVCVVTLVNRKLAAYSWVRYKPAQPSGEMWITFAPGHRYTVWGYTHPEFRGRHLRGSFGALDALDSKHAVTHTITYIDTHNFASLRAEARYGGEIVGLAGYIVVFGRFISFRSPGAKKYQFSFRYSPGA